MKNFNLYFNKLLEFSKVCNVSVYLENGVSLKEKDSSIELGEFDPRGRVISLNSKNPEPVQIATFLHELGHFYDHMKDPKFSNSKKLNKAYSSYIREKPVTAEEKKKIIECERRAWFYGKVIAKILNIPLGKWYDKERSCGMGFYRSIPVKDSQ